MNVLYFTEVFVYSGFKKRREKSRGKGREKGRDGRRKDEGPFTFMSHYNFESLL